MENKNISQIVQERIREEGIKPISRKVFSIKRVLFWVAVASSFVVGAFAFSLILSALFNNDWDLYNKFGFNFIFKTIPYFWLVFLLIFTLLGEFYYKQTSFGYRSRVVVIVGIYMISTAAFGAIFYGVGVGDFIEKFLDESAPTYRNIILNRHQIWANPEEGLLSGQITKVFEDNIEIIDFNGIVWIVDTGDVVIRGDLELESGDRIKIIGNKNEGNNFDADEIRPWMMGGRMMNKEPALSQ